MCDDISYGMACKRHFIFFHQSLDREVISSNSVVVGTEVTRTSSGQVEQCYN